MPQNEVVLQIAEEAQKMTPFEQQELLISIRKNAIIKKARSISARMTPTHLNDDQLLAIINEERKMTAQ